MGSIMEPIPFGGRINEYSSCLFSRPLSGIVSFLTPESGSPEHPFQKLSFVKHEMPSCDFVFIVFNGPDESS